MGKSTGKCEYPHRYIDQPSASSYATGSGNKMKPLYVVVIRPRRKTVKMIGDVTFLTPTEAGQLLGVDRRTIRRWCSDKERPADAPDLRVCRAPNGRVLFPEDHIKALSVRYYGVGSKTAKGGPR